MIKTKKKKRITNFIPKLYYSYFLEQFIKQDKEQSTFLKRVFQEDENFAGF